MVSDRIIDFMNEASGIVSTPNDVLIVTDLHGNIASVSDSVEEVFGYSPSDLINKNIEIFVPVDLRSKHRDHMTRYSYRPHARTMGIGMELHAVRADGTQIPVEVSLRVLRENDRDLVRAIVRPVEAPIAPNEHVSELANRIRQLELTSGDMASAQALVAELTSSVYSGRPVGVWRFESSLGGYLLETGYNMPDGLVGMVTPIDDKGLITQALFVQGVAVVPAGELKVEPDSFMGLLGRTGGVAAAIGGRFEPYGAISVHTGESDQLTLADADELQMIAAELSRFAMTTLTQEALERESDLQAKLAEIGRVFSSSSQMDDVFDTFAELVRNLIPYHRITLAEIDHSTNTILTRYSANADGSDIEGWESGTAHDISGTSAETMVKTKTGLYMNFGSAEEFARQLPGAPDVSAGLTGVLNVPLIVNGVVVGTLTLNTSGDQSFDDASLELGDRIAAQISGSFLTASLSESLELESARRGSLNEIGEIISSSLDFQSIFQKFYESLKSAIDIDAVVITDIDVEAGTKIDFLQHGIAGYEPVLETLEGSISKAVILSNELIAVSASSVAEDERLTGETRKNSAATLENVAMSSWLAAPLLEQGEVIAVMHVLSAQKPEFDTGDCEFMSQVAVRVASAVVNSRLHESAQEYARRQEILAKLSREIGSSLESSESFDRFAALLSELIPVDRVAISNVDVSNQTAETLYESSNEAFASLGQPSFRTHGTPTGHAADIGETVVINNPAEGARFSDWVGQASHSASAVTVPMGRDGEFARIFQVSCVDTDAYGPEQVSLIEQVANQISGAVANQQLYRRSVELGQERERSIRLEAETARLASVNEAKNDFLNLLTHELKTPLTSIIAFADLMRRGSDNELSERQSQQLSVIQRNAWQLDALIQDLVDVSSIERGNIELDPEKTDVVVLVSGVLEGLTPNLEARGQKVDYSPLEDTQSALAEIDRQRITQVVSNLVSNASKYSPKGTTIYVAVERTGNQVLVIVEDEGPGIPESDLRHVFDLFHRVDNELTRKVPGTGQGLYLVKQLVELHGGSVRIGNRYLAGKGTRAVVRLPIEFEG